MVFKRFERFLLAELEGVRSIGKIKAILLLQVSSLEGCPSGLGLHEEGLWLTAARRVQWQGFLEVNTRLLARLGKRWLRYLPA
jgi:hypothetical protein